MSKFEGTPGPWAVDEDGTVHTLAAMSGDIVCNSPGEMGFEYSARFWPENARLIAEAGTVLHETGLTPRQLADQRTALLEAAKLIIDGIDLGGNCDEAYDQLRDAIALAQGDAA